MENTHAPDDEIDLLDLLVTIAENIKLLVLGPLVAGLLALGVSFTLPNTFESKAVINANIEGVNPSVLVSMATTAAVLEPVRQQIGFEPDLPTESALNALRGSINASLGRSDKLITLNVTAPRAEQAQLTNQALVAELFKQAKPRDADLARLSVRLQFEKEALSKVLSLEEELIAIIKSGKESDLLSATYVNVTTMKGSHFAMIQRLEAQLEGLGQSALVQPATLSEKPKSNKKAMVATITALATGFALLLFVFVRQAWRSAGTHAETAHKLLRIRQALGFKS
jgi:LPS O-antigen subunit length determinant protein (WzzB/FepE family)